MKTIYNTYVEMETQEQCNRMKQLCLDNDLEIPIDERDFIMDSKNKFFYYFNGMDVFFICETITDKHRVTENEFIELLKIELFQQE